METLALLAFVLVLTGCMILGLPLLLALAVGYLIFFFYGLRRGHSPLAVLKMSLSGVKTVRTILLLFLLIGCITALWRLCGTIPAIVYYSAGLVRPSIMLLMAFLLNCLVSFLTGTAFGTSATMGVITMTMAMSMDMDPVLTGGAILSGVFFGDRCSPVSTSALLVAELTGTDIFDNIRRMVRTALIPFAVTCLVYLALGLSAAPGTAAAVEIQALFAARFRLGWLPLVPAGIILVLALFRVNVKRSILVSLAAAVAVGLFYQGVDPVEILRAMALGFRASDPQLAAMLNGGGVSSMVRVAAIVCLSSSYAGIFEGTGLLKPLKARLEEAGRRFSPFGCVMGCSVVASMISCNQTLAIMLTHQVCGGVEDGERLALDMENTVVLIAALIPWSIAGAVSLSAVSAPMTSILFACYLYLVPLYNLILRLREERRG